MHQHVGTKQRAQLLLLEQHETLRPRQRIKLPQRELRLCRSSSDWAPLAGMTATNLNEPTRQQLCARHGVDGEATAGATRHHPLHRSVTVHVLDPTDIRLPAARHSKVRLARRALSWNGRTVTRAIGLTAYLEISVNAY